jgi:hypothetical protein
MVYGGRRSAPIDTNADLTDLMAMLSRSDDHAPSCGAGALHRPAQFALTEPRRVDAAIR